MSSQEEFSHTSTKNMEETEEVKSRPRRQPKYTEKGREYKASVEVKYISSLLKQVDKKKDEYQSVVATQPPQVRILSSVLSEIALLKAKLDEQKSKLPSFMDSNDPFFGSLESKLQELKTFIDECNDSLKVISIPDMAGSVRSDASIASKRLQAKLALSEEARQLKHKELALHTREEQLKKELTALQAQKIDVEAQVDRNRILEEAIETSHDRDEINIALEGVKDCTNYFLQPRIEPATLEADTHLKAQETFPQPEFIKRRPGTYFTAQFQPSSAPSTSSRHNLSTIGSNFATRRTRKPNQVDATLLMAKIQLINSLVPFKYKGDSESFPLFREHVRTHLEDSILPDDQKRILLTKFLDGEALRLVQANFGLSYEDSVAMLTRRFGNSAAITEAWVRKLTEGPSLREDNPKYMVELAENLQTASTILKGKAFQELSSKTCLKKIVSRLPAKFVPGWVNYIQRLNDDENIQHLATYVEGVAQSINHPVYKVKQSSVMGPSNKPVVKVRMVTATSSSALSDIDSSEVLQVSSEEEKAVTMKTTTYRSVNCSPSKRKCRFCEQVHLTVNCLKLKAETAAKKREFVMTNNLCWGCLEESHRSRFCTNRAKCKVKGCGRRRPTSLHLEQAPSATANVKVRTTTTNCFETTSFIVPVQVHHPSYPENVQTVYAFLDDGSDACFLTEKLKSQLGVEGIPMKLALTTMHQKTAVTTFKVPGLVMTSYDGKNSIPLPVNTYTRDFIPASTDEIPTSSVACHFEHLQSIADYLPPLLSDINIDLLIGQSCPRALCPIEVKKGEGFEPYAVRTELGWGVIGPKPSLKSKECIEVLSRQVTVKEIVSIFNLEESIEEKNLGLGLSVSDRMFLDKVGKGVRKLPDQHYEIPLPFKQDTITMPNNRPLALRRLYSLKNKFKREKFKLDYTKFVEDMFSKGYAEWVEEDKATPGQQWYLPHHGVYHPKKPDKIRVVFDCSAIYAGTSLNAQLLPSPDLTNSLVGVLLRFRQGQIAFVGDLEGMFLQVRVPCKNRNLLRFLWWEDGDTSKEPKDARMTVHLFGASSSPGCANFALRKTADDHGHKVSPLATKFVKRNFYMDDVSGSVDTVEEAVHLIKDLQQLCSMGGFRLHKLLSTSAEVVRSIPSEDRSAGLKEFDKLGILPMERALGVMWCVESDTFQYKIVVSTRPFTRRSILSTICSTYDPLGFLAPFIVLGKMILQDLCKSNTSTIYDWDEEVDEDTRRRWTLWLVDLKLLSEETIMIPRCYKPKRATNIERIELHHFSDASSAAYGHVTYLRTLYNNGKVHCSFVFGKARVRPLKELTIPRLELTAAVSMAKASEAIARELEYDGDRYFWTDSKVVLGYVKNEKKLFHIFVANRIQIIRDCSHVDAWHHVSSKLNPADLASRGLRIQSLKDSSWLTGPEFLWQYTLPDPSEKQFDISQDDPEIKINARQVCTQERFSDRFEYWSSWKRLVKSVAVALRYMNKLRSPLLNISLKEKPLQVTELINAEKFIIKKVQEDYFRSSWMHKKQPQEKCTTTCSASYYRRRGAFKDWRSSEAFLTAH